MSTCNYFYEWAVEETTTTETDEHEVGEVLDVNHFESYHEAAEFAKHMGEFDTAFEFNIVLIRDGDDGSRAWAYVEDGYLPEQFRDAFGHEVGRVPVGFSREMVLSDLSQPDEGYDPESALGRRWRTEE